MFRAIRRWWRYMGARVRHGVDERADPKIQLEQAIEERQRQHQLLTEQAAAVLANQHQIEIQLGRQIEEVEKLQSSAGQALRLADRARSGGDAEKAEQYEQTARTFATNLASAEDNMANLKGLHDKALVAAGSARQAVQQNRLLLEQQMAEKSKLLTQLEQAKMQERMNASLQTMSSAAITPPGDVPTLDEVRVKIEKRYASALGTSELASTSVDARMLEVQKSVLDHRGEERLAQIRESLGLPAPEDAQIEVMPPRGISEGEPRGITQGEQSTETLELDTATDTRTARTARRRSKSS